jgi:hypothetical protein
MSTEASSHARFARTAFSGTIRKWFASGSNREPSQRRRGGFDRREYGCASDAADCLRQNSMPRHGGVQLGRWL